MAAMAWPSIVAFGDEASGWVVKFDDPAEKVFTCRGDGLPKELCDVIDEFGVRGDELNQVA